jgi:BASS family bile acid:Na+ symporter
MLEVLDRLLKFSLAIFMAGNLLDMGLRLKITDALGGLRNVRFVSLSIIWGFVLCPALAYLLTRIIPLDPFYGMGMVLLGMTPCAPFLPPMVEKARGDMGYAAAYMLIASVVTVVYMPFAVPILVKGLSASAWTTAKPLLVFLLIPLGIGLLVQRSMPRAAKRIHPSVKLGTTIDTILMLALCVILYGKAFAGTLGTYAIGTQILFFTLSTIGPYVLSFGLLPSQKCVISLGMATRNLGAAFAPLFAIPNVDRRAIVMVALGVPMQTICSLLTAIWLGRHEAAMPETVHEKTGVISAERTHKRGTTAS